MNHNNNFDMKYFFLAVTTAIIFAACGSSSTGNADLDSLIAKRDSLKGLQSNIAKELAAVEEQIALLDTGIKAPAVAVMPVMRQNFKSYFEVQGYVTTDAQANVFPNPMGQGIIKKIFAKEGDRVTAGQKLAQIDDAVTRQMIGQLEVNLAVETENYNRLKKLWDQKIGSEMQVLQARRAKENFEEQIKQVKEQIAQYTITAPISGTVDKIYLKEGEAAAMASPMPVLTILNPGNNYMLADISESYIGIIKEGQNAEIIIPNLDTISTNIALIGNTIKKANRTFEIRMNLPQGNANLKPNLVGSVRLAEYAADSTVVLPSSLIMKDAEERSFVFINDNMKAKKVIVTTGKSYEGQTEILNGLGGGESVISKGARKLVDGQEIRISNI
ncbi:MAG: efflux RND transporter periplasmic adaptor subunit [Flavobacteriales bacterium]|jgi:membrane fusion protein (multidrug efflux system)